jgi:hypothetical protein
MTDHLIDHLIDHLTDHLTPIRIAELTPCRLCITSSEPPQVLSELSGPTSIITSEFEALRTQARDSLAFAQARYLRNYNEGRLPSESEAGDPVLTNTRSLHLHGDEPGTGKKLLKKFEGPFEITGHLSPVTYRLRLPSSYHLHSVINIAHLEPYRLSPDSLGPRASIPFENSLEAEEEWEVEKIVAERTRKERLSKDSSIPSPLRGIRPRQRRVAAPQLPPQRSRYPEGLGTSSERCAWQCRVIWLRLQRF